MARKDVNLVIRAKDEAAKVVDAITAAINEFADSQRDLQTRSEKTESSLGQLGAAFRQLDGAIKGLDVAGKLAGDLGKAERAMERLDAEVKETSADVTRLSQSFRNAESSTDRLRAKTEGAAAAQERQRVAVRTASAAQKELARAANQSATAQDRLAAKAQKLPAQIAKQEALVAKTARRYEELSAEMLGTAQPTATLRRNLEASNRALTSQQQRLAQLRGDYDQVVGDLRAAGSAATIFAQQAEDASRNLARQESVLAKITDNYERLKQQSRAAGANQADLEKALAGATEKLQRQTKTLQDAQAEYRQLASASREADAALERLSAASLGNLQEQLRGQRKAMLEAKREYLGLSEAATRLATDIGRAGVPTREMSQEFARTKAEARAAKTAYEQKRETLERMNRALRQTGSDLQSLSNTQQRFTSLQERQAAALQQTEGRLKEAKAEIAGLHREATRASTSMQRLGSATRQQAAAAAQSAAQTGRLAAAYQQLYGGTRQSLSFTQRLRGEVLSLIAAYGGFFAVIEVLNGVVNAYQKLEAAQARLSVAVGGDNARTAQELDFVRRTADRLGIEFGVLAQEYSKFSIAAKDTAIEGEATRKIFTSVAEAARVNRSSTKELSGVFVALTQIVSKGAVQMEELRQQLGDRLPGALQIMAAGLGVTTAELIKMMEAGQITEEALVPFAEELDRRFGAGLSEALEGTSTALGRLQNAAFQALLTFGRGGFIDAFTDLANTLTETLRSADFQSFLEGAARAASALLRVIGALAENFDLVVAAGTAFIALKLTPFLVLVAEGFARVSGNARAATASLAASRGAMVATGAAASGAAGGVGRMATAMRALTSATGVGLIFAAIGGAIGYWATQADSATEALVEHRRIVDLVKNAYDDVGGSVDDWRANIENLTVTEARRNLAQLQQALESTKRSFQQAIFEDGESAAARLLPFGRYLSGVSDDYSNAARAIFEAFESGEITAAEFVERVDELNEKFNDGSRANERFANALIDAANEIEEYSNAADEAEKIVEAMTGSTEDAQRALDELNGAARDFQTELGDRAVAATEKFESALSELKELMPQLDDEMAKFSSTIDGIETAFQKALSAARAMPDAIMRIAAEQQALAAANSALTEVTQRFVDANFGSFTDGTEAAAALIRQFEGFRSTPYWDVNALRAGFGSDTVTLEDGSVQRVVEGTRVSVADANRDLIRRITQEFMPIAEAAAGGRFDTFTPQQQAALTSIAYNYGEIPDRIAEAVRSGTDEQIAAAIRGLAGDNDGVNRDRRLQEAALFTSGAAVETQIAEQTRLDEQRAREAERRAEEEARAREATQQRLADGQFELEQQRLLNQERGREAAIREAIREARAQDPNITEEEIAKIREQTGALFDAKNAQDEVTTAKERAEEAERRVNLLLQERRALNEQLEAAQASGDSARVDELQAKIAEVNTELAEAIQNAKQMWEAVGGQAADTAIAKLDAAGTSADNLSQSAQKNYLDWSRVGDLFVTGLTDAFMSFAEAVAAGEDAGKAAREAFLQFAADFLLQIARMIIQQAIFNALQSAFGGTPFGQTIGVGHTGGLVGSSRVGSGNSTRRVNPAVFAGAPRYHTGGIVGVRPGEVPIIAKEGEEMLTRDDPRHVLNGGGKSSSQGSSGSMRVINVFDGAAALQEALSTPEGAEVFLNFVRKHRNEISLSSGR